MKFLIDTNVFREIGKTIPDRNVAQWLNQIDDADLALSALTVREVRKGIAKLKAKKPDAAKAIDQRTSEGFAAFGERILPITSRIADEWGRLLAERDKHVDDMALVATALVHRLVLVTRNLKDVENRGVPTFDPYMSSAKITPL